MAVLRLDIEPSILAWARESIGLSREEAAKQIGIYPLDLRFWEEGVGGPTLPQLQSMSEAYDRPLAAFFLSEPPVDSDSIPDFRQLPENQSRAWSPQLHGAFRRIQLQREAAKEIAEIADELPPPLDLSLRTDLDPEEAGESVRSWLGASFLHESPTNEINHLGRWIVLIEDKAILVAQVQGVQLEEMRGMSIAESPFPAIAINGKDAPGGKLFTLLHELTHVLLRSGGLCDLGDGRGGDRTPGERLERFCNHVAAATLMPRSVLLHDARVSSAPATTRWTDTELRSLARRFGVSSEAMLLRLVTLERASADYYRERRAHFLAIYAGLRERDANDKRATGGPSYYRMKIRNFGRRYVTSVLAAYHRRDITGAELADYLDIKLDRVPKLEEALEERR
jgi:Zn-dependent peptidase ImmA (M78 family)